jgi:hypothetical protein
MEFEATYIVPPHHVRALMRLYQRRHPSKMWINLCQSKAYIDTRCGQLHETGRSACITIDRTMGTCLLHKFGTEVLDGYVARQEERIAIGEPPAATPISGIRAALSLRSNLRPVMVLESSRRYLVLQKLPQPVLISFDAVRVRLPAGEPLFRFGAIELECNGEAPHTTFIQSLCVLNRLLHGYRRIASKYRYAMEVHLGESDGALA